MARERSVTGAASILNARYLFIGKGDASLLLVEVQQVRERAQKLVNERGLRLLRGFSWPLDAFGGRLGYWLHVGIVQTWNREVDSYTVHALRWLESDTNILLCLLAVERQVRADVISCVSEPEARHG
jgi:hypothetical protein